MILKKNYKVERKMYRMFRINSLVEQKSSFDYFQILLSCFGTGSFIKHIFIVISVNNYVGREKFISNLLQWK